MIVTDFNKIAVCEILSAWELFGAEYEINDGEVKNVILSSLN